MSVISLFTAWLHSGRADVSPGRIKEHSYFHLTESSEVSRKQNGSCASDIPIIDTGSKSALDKCIRTTMGTAQTDGFLVIQVNPVCIPMETLCLLGLGLTTEDTCIQVFRWHFCFSGSCTATLVRSQEALLNSPQTCFSGTPLFKEISFCYNSYLKCPLKTHGLSIFG